MTTVFRGSAEAGATVPAGDRPSAVSASAAAAAIFLGFVIVQDPLSFLGRDREVVEGAACPLAEEPLAQRDRHAPLRRFRVLERESVDATQQAVPDVHR